MKTDAEAAKARAEASFRKPEQPASEGAAAREDQALRDRTAKLRELRLAKEAADLAARPTERKAP